MILDQGADGRFHLLGVNGREGRKFVWFEERVVHEIRSVEELGSWEAGKQGS
jgi:hypothetical protein